MHTVYASSRREMLPYVPDGVRRVLDVGCALGRFGQALRTERPDIQVWGVDPVTEARPDGYVGFWRGTFPDAIPPGEKFDCIVFNDVLEHMVDPWAALRQTEAMMAPGGSIVASLPNIRNLRTIVSLLLRNEWRHEDSGVHDRTHLRFFTSKTMKEMFEVCGFVVDRIEPINLPERGQRGTIRRMSFGIIDGFIAEQFAICARIRA